MGLLGTSIGFSNHKTLRNERGSPAQGLVPAASDPPLARPHACPKLAPGLAPPGPLQLAGGTNAATLEFLRPAERPAGIAFGGVARRLLMPVLDEAQTRRLALWQWPEGWQSALSLARPLVAPWLQRSC